MKRLFSLLLFVALLGIVAFATNPDEQKFKDYMKKEYAQGDANDSELERDLKNIFSGLLSGLVPFEREDKVLYSVYVTQNIDGEQHVFIGAFGHFFALSQDKQ